MFKKFKIKELLEDPMIDLGTKKQLKEIPDEEVYVLMNDDGTVELVECAVVDFSLADIWIEAPEAKDPEHPPQVLKPAGVERGRFSSRQPSADNVPRDEEDIGKYRRMEWE